MVEHTGPASRETLRHRLAVRVGSIDSPYRNWLTVPSILALAVDDATFTDTYSGGDVVTDTTRAAEVQAMLADVELPQALETLETDLIDRRGANSRYQEIAEVSGTIACALLDLHFNSGPAGPWEPAAALAASTEWDMLLEIEDQGGWSSAVWQTAAAIGGDGLTPPTTTIGGGQAPTLESLAPGLGCDTR